MRRRAVLACLAAAGLAAGGSRGYAATPSASPRLVVLDWSLTELLLSAGIVPVGVSNSTGFRRTYTACALPDTVVDLGLMFQPNLELLLALKPDRIIVTPAHAALRTSLERIAPIVTFGQFRSSPTPYSAAMKETLSLGRLFGHERAAADVIAAADVTLKQARASIAAKPGIRERPLYLARFIDENYLRVYGTHSFHGELLGLLGLDNAWRDRTGASAFSTRRLDDLDAAPRSTLVYFEPLVAAAASMMKSSPLWRAMPFAKPGGMLGLPFVPPDGGALSATFFVRALTQALTSELPHADAAVCQLRRLA
jgi:ferric hydroxamate transport system substrate-binding protein